MAGDENRKIYVFRVNAHRQRWDGSVCANPTDHADCQAKTDFKAAFCAKGRRNCLHLNLFEANDPCIALPINDTPTGRSYAEVFDEQPPVRGDVALFWATYRDRANFPVGLWEIDRFTPGVSPGDNATLFGDPGSLIRFPERAFNWNSVDNRLTRQWGAEVLRMMEPGKFSLVLDEFIAECHSLSTNVPVRPDILEIKRSEERLAELRRLFPEVGPGLTFRMQIPKILPIADHPPAEPKQSDIQTESNGDVPDEVQLQLADASEPADAAVGLHRFPAELVKTYRLALRVRPLVILAGPSGVGKTQLVISVAEDVLARRQIISVRPDWRANEDLMGYLPPFGNEHFVPSSFSQFVLEAGEEFAQARAEGTEPIPYHLCLDEMNLARPEYYMAEFLSKMEMPATERYLQLYEGEADRGFPRRLWIPPNLRIIGTVNNDETTFPLSPKVLDRSIYMVIDEVDLATWFDSTHSTMTPHVRGPLLELGKILRPLDICVGYRLADQFLTWVDEDVATGTSFETAFDSALAMLILSKLRLQRSNPAHSDGLRHLIAFLEGFGSPEEDLMQRSISRISALQEELERSEFAFGQLGT